MSHFFSNIKHWFSELSGVFQILIIGLTLFIVGEVLSGYFGKTYVKMYPNKQSSSVAIQEFKNVCGRCTAELKDDGVEYEVFYDSKGEAINSFMLIARRLNGIYSNGKFRHCYMSQNERIFRCCDKNRKIIAMRYKKHRAIPLDGIWEPTYSIQFYVEK